MICPNCNREIDDDNIFCKFCGTQIKNEEDQNQDISENEIVDIQEENPEDQMIVDDANTSIVDENAEEDETEDEEDIIKEQKRAKRRHSLITIGIVIAVLGVIFAIIYGVIMFLNTPDKVYKRLISKGTDIIFNSKSSKSNSVNTNTHLQVKSDIKDLSDTLNGLKVDTSFQYDFGTEQYYVNANIDQGSNSYLKLNLLASLSDKKLYVSESNMYNKVVGLILNDSHISHINSFVGRKEGITNTNIISKIVSDVVKRNIPKSYFSKGKVTINIDGKQKKVTDNIISLNLQQFKEICTNSINELKSNEELLNNYERRDDVERVLNLALDTIKILDNNISENYEIHYLTSGIFNSFEGIKFVVVKGSTKEIYEIVRSSQNTFSVTEKTESTTQQKTSITGTLVLDNSVKDAISLKTNLNVVGSGNIEIEFANNAQYNMGMSNNFDIQNPVNKQDITDEDIKNIYTKFIKSPIYSTIMSISDTLGKKLNFDFGIDMVDNYEVPSDIELEENQSFVSSKDNDVVKFYVPTTLSSTYKSDGLKSYLKGDENTRAYIDVSCDKITSGEYISYVQETFDRYKQQAGYKNFNISDVQNVEIGGRTFSKISTEVSYRTELGTYFYEQKNTYYFIPINEKYLYKVEVDDEYGLLTNEEIERFLTVQF